MTPHWRGLFLGLLAPGLLFSAVGKENSIRFTEVAADAGLQFTTRCGSLEKRFIVEGNGTGCVWLDYNGDGWSDLYVVNGILLDNLFRRLQNPDQRPNALFRNNGDGTFTEVTSEAGVAGTGLGNGVAVADVNNDGLLDLFVTNYGPDLLYVNRGDGRFSDVSLEAGIQGGWQWSTGASFGDYNRDGYADLYVARYLHFDTENPPLEGEFCKFRGVPVMCGPSGLPAAHDSLFRNNGDGTFTDVTSTAGIKVSTPRYGFSSSFEDFDNDGWQDIFVTNDSGPNFLFQNQKDGTFKDMGLLAGVSYNQEGRAQANMGLALGDRGHDGWTDLFITTFSEDYYPFFQNLGGMNFSDKTTEIGLANVTIPYLGWATFFFDFDNDGSLDLFMANGHLYPQAGNLSGSGYAQSNLLLQGLASGFFKDISEATGLRTLAARSSRGAAYCDFDNDGDLDIAELAIDGPVALLRNEGGNRNNWIQMQLLSSSGGPALGARLQLVSQGRVQRGRVRSGGNYLSQNDFRLHFGLGRSRTVDRIQVEWSNGLKTELEEVAAGQLMVLKQPVPETVSGPQ